MKYHVIIIIITIMIDKGHSQEESSAGIALSINTASTV